MRISAAGRVTPLPTSTRRPLLRAAALLIPCALGAAAWLAACGVTPLPRAAIALAPPTALLPVEAEGPGGELALGLAPPDPALRPAPDPGPALAAGVHDDADALAPAPLAAQPAPAAPQPPPLPPLDKRWFYYMPSASQSSFVRHWRQMDFVSPVWFNFQPDGSISGVEEPLVATAVRAAGARLVPLVGDVEAGPDMMHRVLAAPAARLHAIQAVVGLVLANDYDGIHLDVEGLPPSDREALVSFVRDIAIPLRSHGKLTTIAVAAKAEETTTGWAGPYDYRALGELCDLVAVMAYDYHVPSGAPGPVAPLDWVEGVLRYATSQIPPSKLLLGVPFYGYGWNTTPGTPGWAMGYDGVLAAAAAPGATLRFDPAAQAFNLQYPDQAGNRYDVWFEDGNSLGAKLAAARRYGVTGFAAWRLGLEDPNVWMVIAASTPVRPDAARR